MHGNIEKMVLEMNGTHIAGERGRALLRSGGILVCDMGCDHKNSAEQDQMEVLKRFQTYVLQGAKGEGRRRRQSRAFL